MWSPRDVQQVIPADVVSFSGCKDKQTSADVYDTAGFGLSQVAGPGGAGGACTNSMIKALEDRDHYSWVELLGAMRAILEQKGYEQIPELSTSRQKDLRAPFTVIHPSPSGRCRALLIGINYVGTSSELKGCHNDVETMRRFIASQGYSGDDVHILADDARHPPPTTQNMWAGVEWLIRGAGEGDSLFFHYSGHGSRMPDDNGDEADGWDEALVPLDYESVGLIRDDEVFLRLVAPLPAGVQLTCVMDCCHSGTILDLPYLFRANTDSLQAVNDGSLSTMQANPGFDIDAVMTLIQENPRAAAGLAVVGGIVGGIALANMSAEQRAEVAEAGLEVAEGRDSGLNFLMVLGTIIAQLCCSQEEPSEREP